MAWLADLAGKAEGMLTQLDQSAASALQKPSAGSSRSVSLNKQLNEYASRVFSNPDAPSSAFTSVEVPLNRETRSGYASSVSSLPMRPKVSENTGKGKYKKDDEVNEKLIDFLNDPESLSVKRSSAMSRRSSDASLRSLPISASVPFSAPDESNAALIAIDPFMQGHSDVTTQFPSSASAINELKAREIDYQKTIRSKDNQLAVLRVCLQDTDQQLQLKTEKLNKLEAEQRRLFIDSADSNVYKAEAFENLERKLKEAESEIDRERNICKKLEADFLNKIQRLEGEQSNILQQLTASQKMLTDEKIRCSEYAEQLKLAKYNLESNKLEFDEYKQKATRILQSKEKLIATLKEEGASLSTADSTDLLMQLEETRTERDMLKEDLQQAHLQVFNLRGETQELESRLAQEQRASLEQQRHLQEQCQTYQQSSAQYREEYEQLKQDCQFVQDEMRRQHAMFQNKLKEKDAEISRLITQVTQRPVREVSNSESELRIRQLTENLIQKQTVIEALQTDKQTLSLQLERIEKLYREAESAAIRASSTIIDMGTSEEGVHSRIPAFLRETPYDTGMARSVKKAYSTVEKFSVRFGLFLRRYPTARIFLLTYAICLHLWVIVVLLTYSPEVHSIGYVPNAEPKK